MLPVSFLNCQRIHTLGLDRIQDLYFDFDQIRNNTLDIAVGVIIADYPGIDLLGRLENIDKRSSVHGYVVLPLKLGDLLLNALPPVVGQDIGQGEAPHLFGRFESLHREDHAPEVVTASMEVSCSDEPRGGCDLICNEHGQKDRAWLNSTIS